MKRTALLLGGLVGVISLSAGAAGLAGANAASPGRRVVAVKTPAPAKVAVAVVRFPRRAADRPPKLRLARPFAGATSTAAAAGVVRLPGRGGYVGLVAIASFRTAAAPASAARPILRISAPQPLVVVYAGDGEHYRGRVSLSSLVGRAWRPDVALASTGADARYRRGRALLAQVTRLLAGSPDPSFLAALRGPSATPPPPASAPPPAPSPAPTPPAPPPSPRPVVQISSDPFTNPSSQHRAQVEPDSFAFGPRIVAAFQSGRFVDGGSSGIGFATSDDSGATWSHGFLPKLTTYTADAGTYDRATDPSVAYDAKHGVWLIQSLAMIGIHGTAVVVSRSTDGGHSWGAPVTIASYGDLDKNWIVCDDHPASPHYGNCYSEWDDEGNNDAVAMSTSSDGGATWSLPVRPADLPSGLGGQPLVRPDGTVVVPFVTEQLEEIRSFSSSDGGASWSASTLISAVEANEVAADLRAESLPAAEIDGAGTVYVVWQDCRFRLACAVPGAYGNDLVLSTSSDGSAWTAPKRVPIDASAGGDYFIPGLGVDPGTAGGSARLALAFYYYPTAACTAATCQLDAGLISSADGGASWGGTVQLAGPMSIAWLPSTTGGRMVGDYISTSFSGGVAYPFFAVAHAPAGGQLDEAIYTLAP